MQPWRIGIWTSALDCKTTQNSAAKNSEKKNENFYFLFFYLNKNTKKKKLLKTQFNTIPSNSAKNLLCKYLPK
jgi:hypothetical protein